MVSSDLTEKNVQSISVDIETLTGLRTMLHEARRYLRIHKFAAAESILVDLGSWCHSVTCPGHLPLETSMDGDFPILYPKAVDEEHPGIQRMWGAPAKCTTFKDVLSIIKKWLTD